MSKGSVIKALVVMVMAALPFSACDDDGSAPYDPGGDPTTAGGGDGAKGGRFFLPTGEPDNTSAPSVEIDGKGNVHMVYPAYAGGDAYYATCGAGCRDEEDVRMVHLQTDGTVHNAMIALDGSGRPQILLQTASYVYYATCDGDCTQAASWTTTRILDHHGDREVDGEAFALDPQGRPRFMMHTYKAYLGVGQKPPEAFYVACDGACHDPESWKPTKVADQMWRHSTLRFDKSGAARVATVVTTESGERAAYVECVSGCDRAEAWNGITLGSVFESDVEAVAFKPSLSMALTRDGAPRIVFVGKNGSERNITYFECDRGCTGNVWRGSILSTFQKLSVGIDLALDAKDHPRFAHTLDYNIALAYCDADDCAAQDAPWDLTKVEYGGDMKADKIFPYPNCTVGAWFLHSPSLALTTDGKPRVGYQARDISGGWQNPDPWHTPDCRAGTDMTWSRLALLGGVK